jgi:hypothetical protein
MLPNLVRAKKGMNRSHGLTLIELLVVIPSFAMLAAPTHKHFFNRRLRAKRWSVTIP